MDLSTHQNSGFGICCPFTRDLENFIGVSKTSRNPSRVYSCIRYFISESEKLTGQVSLEGLASDVEAELLSWRKEGTGNGKNKLGKMSENQETSRNRRKH